MKKKFRGNSYMSIVEGKLESNPRFSNYSGDSLGANIGNMNTQNSKLTFNIANGSAEGTFILFGNDEFYVPNGYAVNSGCSSGIVVTCIQSSAQQVAADSAKGPFIITGFKVRTSDITNFSKLMYIRMKSSTGAVTEMPVDFQQFENPVNNQEKLLVASPDDFTQTVTGMIAFRGTIAEASTMSFFFVLGGRTNLGAVLDGKPAVSVSTQNFPWASAPTVLIQPGSNGVAANVPLVSGTGTKSTGK